VAGNVIANRQRPPTSFRVICEVCDVHRLDHHRHFHVAKMANVEFAMPIQSHCPPQQDIARRLHQALANDDPFAMGCERA